MNTKRIDLLLRLSQRGYDTQHPTLTKWLRIYGEETGRVQGRLLDVGVGETIIAAVELMRDGEGHETPMTFREALRLVLERLERTGESAAPLMPVTAGGSGLGAEHAAMLDEVLRHARAQVVGHETLLDELRAIQARLEVVEEKVAAVERREATFDLDEALDIVAGARQAMKLANGFHLFTSDEGAVVMPRTAKFIPVETPEPGPTWWQQSWSWLAGWFSRAG